MDLSHWKCRNNTLFDLVQFQPQHFLVTLLPSDLLVDLIEVSEGFMPVFGGGDGLDNFIHGGHVAASLVAALHPHAGSVPGVQAAHSPQHLRVLRRPAPDALGSPGGLEAVGPDRETGLGVPLRVGGGGRGGGDDPRPLHPQQPSGRGHGRVAAGPEIE